MNAVLPYLPAATAALNAAAATFLLLGFAAIRGGNRETHRRFMLGAFAASSLFLAVYLTRYALTGTTHFEGEGLARWIYLAILGSHMFLAIALVPMVLGTLRLSFRGRFPEHRRLARWTFPIWVYVSVTGVIVYLMLHHLPV